MTRTNFNGDNALMLSSKYNTNPEIISLIIENNININYKNNFKETPLMYAAKYNPNKKVIKKLLDLGANRTLESNSGMTAYEYAKENSSIKDNNLLKRLEVNIFELAKHEWPNRIENLITQENLNVNLKDEEGKSVLMYAAENNNDPMTISILVSLGSKVNDRDNDGNTALMLASKNNSNPDVTTKLVEFGLDINARNDLGETPLMQASTNNNADIVKRLLRYSPDINAKNHYGTALNMAAFFNPNPKIIKKLIENGANLNPRTFHGTVNNETPLSTLLFYYKEGEDEYDELRMESAIKLIEAGANVNINILDRLPLLMYSLANGIPTEVIISMINNGANVNGRYLGSNLTALMYAAGSAKDPKIIELMLEKGADGTIRNHNGQTAFDLAKDNDYIVDTDVYWRLNDAQFNY